MMMKSMDGGKYIYNNMEICWCKRKKDTTTTKRNTTNKTKQNNEHFF